MWDPLSTPIAVVVGVAQELPLRIQQAEIHRPGIDADPGQRFVIAGGIGPDPGLDLPPEVRCIPVEAALLLEWIVGKAMELVEGETLPVPASPAR